MKRSTRNVALDVHQASTVASVREESGRGIATPGQRICHLKQRALWLARLSDPGARFRAPALRTQLEGLQ